MQEKNNLHTCIVMLNVTPHRWGQIIFPHVHPFWTCNANNLPAIRGAFHQAFCQCFSLTTVISYWNPCIWLAESKFVSEKHWQNAWWNAPPGPQFHENAVHVARTVLNAGNFLWMAERVIHMWPLFSLFFGPAIGQKVNFSEWIWISNTSYVQTVPNHRRLLIIDDKSLPHKRRSFTQLLIFKIKFLSAPPTRWLTGSAEMTPVIGNARRVHGEVTLTFELVD